MKCLGGLSISSRWGLVCESLSVLRAADSGIAFLPRASKWKEGAALKQPRRYPSHSKIIAPTCIISNTECFDTSSRTYLVKISFLPRLSNVFIFTARLMLYFVDYYKLYWALLGAASKQLPSMANALAFTCQRNSSGSVMSSMANPCYKVLSSTRKSDITTRSRSERGRLCSQ